MTLREILAPLDELLKRHKIRYAVIGGYAVAAWGELRATRDVDLLCSATDLTGLKSALREAKLNFEHRTGDADDPISDVIWLQAGTGCDAYEIDLFVGIRGAPGGIFERSRGIRVDDLEVAVVSPEDTIILKLLAGSARDLEDARSIIRVQHGRLDISLIRGLCPSSISPTLEALLNSESANS